MHLAGVSLADVAVHPFTRVQREDCVSSQHQGDPLDSLKTSVAISAAWHPLDASRTLSRWFLLTSRRQNHGLASA